MLGFVLGCFTWGALKAVTLDARRTHALGASVFPGPILEELQFRLGVERLGLSGGLNLSPEQARLVGAVIFGLGHPGLEIDATVGGYVYSKAFDAYGLPGAILAHAAHNFGCWAGSR